MLDPRELSLTSPGTVVGDLIVVGSSVADLVRADAPHGIVRAFDTRSGRLRWTFHTIPAKGEPGSETWKTGTAHTGAANVWSTITADLERGLVFLPVSSASPDHYGGDRPGANLYSDSVVALDAKTGKLKWQFQTVHHDLWDYDLAAPPILIDIRRDGRDVPAVVVLTKTSLVFVLHRETGEPLFPVEERRSAGERRTRRAGMADTAVSRETAAALLPQNYAKPTSTTDARASRRLLGASGETAQ